MIQSQHQPVAVAKRKERREAMDGHPIPPSPHILPLPRPLSRHLPAPLPCHTRLGPRPRGFLSPLTLRLTLLLALLLACCAPQAHSAQDPLAVPPQLRGQSRAPAADIECSPWSWRTCIHLGRGVRVLAVNPEQGSGMVARQHYLAGMFSMDIKLHAGDSGGVIFAWYLMDTVTKVNTEYDHSEIDMEFYGNTSAKTTMLSLNVYADGHQNLAQFTLPWDPSAAYHNYAIKYNTQQIIWFIDGRPIRILNRVPGKPWPRYALQPQATVWETKWTPLKANFSNGPIAALFATYRAAGCEVNHTANLKPQDLDGSPCQGPWNQPPTEDHMRSYERLHIKHLIADYGWDKLK